MQESAQHYIARITGLVGDRQPRSILAATPARLRSLVDTATPAARAWTSSADRWTITQIVAHLADAEIVGAWRFRSVLGQNGVGLQAYDQNVWATAFHYEQADAMESVALFDVLRAATLRTLDRVDPERLAHAAHHQERGVESVAHIQRMYAGHDLNHLGQIERLLEEARRAPA